MKIISCSEAVKRIFDYLDSALTSSRRQQLDEHLEVCRHCCDRFEFERLLQEKVREVSKEETVPDEVKKRVEGIIEKF